MYVQPYKHPLNKSALRKRVRERWNDPKSGRESPYYELVLSLIKEGGGKHFLNYAFYRGELPILKDDLDLRGLKLWQIDQDFREGGDNFKGISFAYGEWWHCKFKNCVFYSCDLDFLEAYGCTFEKCAFVFTHFVGAKFEKCTFIDCDFGEPCSWENGTFLNTKFERCFLGQTTPFNECLFDDRTAISNMLPHSPHFGEKVSTPKEALSGYYQSFLAAYEASGSEELASKYYWEARKAYTRYNLAGFKRVLSLFNEAITGYGSRPLRPLAALVLAFIFGVLVFSTKVKFEDSLLLTAGAIFTFGASTSLLEPLGVWWRLLYISLSFAGVTGTAMFITSLANLWFGSKVPTPTVKTAYTS